MEDKSTVVQLDVAGDGEETWWSIHKGKSTVVLEEEWWGRQ